MTNDLRRGKRSLPYSTVLVICLVNFILFGILMYFFSATIGFLYSIAPKDTSDLTIAKGSNALATAASTIFLKYHSPEYEQIASAFRTIIIMKKGQGVYVLGLPKPSMQFNVRKLLENNNFTVKRIAWLVVARQGHWETKLINQSKSIAQYLYRFKLFQPKMSLYIRNGGTTPVELLGFKTKNGLAIQITTRGSSQLKVPEHAYSKSIYSVRLSIPAKALEFLADEELNMLAKMIKSTLGITHDAVQIKSATLVNFKRIAVELNADEFLVSFTGRAMDRMEYVSDSIIRDRGFDHHRLKQFILPDGSLAYEYVADENHAFTSEGMCGVVRGKDTVPVYVCRDKLREVIGSDALLVRQRFSQDDDSVSEGWQLFVGGEEAQALSGGSFRSLSAYGDSRTAIVELTDSEPNE